MRAPHLDDGDVVLYLGDCIEVMAEMDAESVDAVVTDPPYGIGFMGKAWDAAAITERVERDNASRGSLGPDSPTRPGRKKPRSSSAYGNRAIAAGPVRDHTLTRARSGSMHAGEYDLSLTANAAFAAWCETWAREALRVLKPGGHLLAFGGTRTYHRLTVGIEDAGFEIRDCLSWLYGSGFPKSLDVSKAIDRKRDDRDDVLAVTAEIARLRDAVGMTNRDLDAVFGFAGMAGHWTSTKTQPTIPTVEQWAALREMLDPPAWVEAEVWRLNGRKGEPGEAWKSRPVTGKHDAAAPAQTWKANNGIPHDLTAKDRRDIPATDAAQQWQGWGTALKPGWEPCVVARKPLAGTVAENVQAHGTGAINVDGCRIAGDVPSVPQPSLNSPTGLVYGYKTGEGRNGEMSAAPGGRWPANVVLDEQAAAMLDAQSGERGAVAPASGPTHNGPSDRGSMAGPFGGMGDRAPQFHGDTGGASRFFYTAKASRADRNTSGADNTHPTVKPTDLMRWLVRLVTPPGGVVLDPFAGSGSTLVAARAEGFRSIGIEREAEYAEIIAARLSQLSLLSEAS